MKKIVGACIAATLLAGSAVAAYAEGNGKGNTSFPKTNPSGMTMMNKNEEMPPEGEKGMMDSSMNQNPDMNVMQKEGNSDMRQMPPTGNPAGSFANGSAPMMNEKESGMDKNAPPAQNNASENTQLAPQDKPADAVGQAAAIPANTSQSGMKDTQLPPSGNPGGLNEKENTPPMNFEAGMPEKNTSTYTSAATPTEIITSTVVNTAKTLSADQDNAVTYTMSDENKEIRIDEAGTYIITGTCADGNITVKKNTTGVVLILQDLDLTSTSGATLSLNKNSEVKVVVEGSVTLTDNEDAQLDGVDDNYDGAAIKAKDGSNVYLTGTGTLTINGNSKNGIKVGDEGTPSFEVDGSLTVDITAVNDGINAGYDLSILSGTVNVSAGDDGIHADRILTIGSEEGGPIISIIKAYEGLEGTVVNLFGGSGTISASDDAVNAANGDGLYEDELTYSINITGGEWKIDCSGDGLDSNGNINVTGGTTTIHSGSQGGEAGLDYTGELYVKEGTLNNNSGVAFDAGMGQPGMMQDMQRPNAEQPGMMQDMPDNMQKQSGPSGNAPQDMMQGNRQGFEQNRKS